MGGGTSKEKKDAAKRASLLSVAPSSSTPVAWAAVPQSAATLRGRKPRALGAVHSMQKPPGVALPTSPPRDAKHASDDVVVMASPLSDKGHGRGPSDPSPKLAQLKQMLQNGLIDQADFDERKRQLLDGLVADDSGGGGGGGGLLPPSLTEGVLIKQARVMLLVKPLDEDLEPWEEMRWWESGTSRHERVMRLLAGTDTLEWSDIASGERLGSIHLRDSVIRRTSSRPRGQGAPGFLVMSRAEEGELLMAGRGHRTEVHIRFAVSPAQDEARYHTRTGEGTGADSSSAWDEFESWMSAIAPFLPQSSVGVSLRFLNRFLDEHPEIAKEDMSAGEVYQRFVLPGLAKTEAHLSRILRDRPADEGDVSQFDAGPTTVFVSYAHTGSFKGLVATLASSEMTAVRDAQQNFRAFYWLDAFCQPQATPQAAEAIRRTLADERATLKMAFQAADVAGHGGLSMGGFAAALQRLGVSYSNDVLRQLMQQLDVNNNGTIELPEFEAVVAEWRMQHPNRPPLAATAAARSYRSSALRGEPGEGLSARRRCIEAAWHPMGLPKFQICLTEWPLPSVICERLGCWYDSMMAIELGADIAVELSLDAKTQFLQQVQSGELSFTLDQRPRWNKARPGLYSSGPVAQSIDVRQVAAKAKRDLTAMEQAGRDERWPHPIKAAEVDWILHEVNKLPVQSYRTVGGRWVTRGAERLNMAVRSAVEEALYGIYQQTVIDGQF